MRTDLTPSRPDLTPILELRDIFKSFGTRKSFLRPRRLTVIDKVDLAVTAGTTVALVGESGSGKTTLARIALGLMKPDRGQVLIDGRAIAEMSSPERRRFRRRVQPVFQDPLSSLNPRHNTLQIVSSPLKVHHHLTRDVARSKVLEVLEQVGLDERHLMRYPHELSGGQNQRVAIARALILKPELIIADEPTSALDVSVQAQLLALMTSIQRDYGLAFLFISHNLAVVKHIAHFVGVMYLGRIVEFGTCAQIFSDPQHPYTQALLDAVPIPDPLARKARRKLLGGSLPDISQPPIGCRFQPRCPLAINVCLAVDPPNHLTEHGHAVACHLAPTAIDNWADASH